MLPVKDNRSLKAHLIVLLWKAGNLKGLIPVMVGEMIAEAVEEVGQELEAIDQLNMFTTVLSHKINDIRTQWGLQDNEPVEVTLRHLTFQGAPAEPDTPEPIVH